MKRLSLIQNKIDLYSKDPYFSYGYEVICENHLQSKLHNLAGVMLKPESFLTGKANIIVDYYVNIGFKVINFKVFSFNKNELLSFYFYPLHSATRERIKLLELWAKNNSFIYILLYIPQESFGYSASTFASILKGHSAQTNHNTIRYKLGKPVGILNYLHTSDESLDLVRDLAIVLTTDELENIIRWTNLENNNYDSLIKEINNIIPNNIISEISYENSLNHIKKQANKFENSEFTIQIRQFEESGSWIKLFDFLDLNNINIDIWHKIIVAAAKVKLYKYESEPRIQSIISYLNTNGNII